MDFIFDIEDIVDYSFCPMFYKNKKESTVLSVDSRYKNVMCSAIYSYMISIQNNCAPRVSTLFATFGSNWIGSNKTVTDMLFSEPTTWRDKENIKRKQGLSSLKKFHDQISKKKYEVLAVNTDYSFKLTKNVTLKGRVDVVRGFEDFVELIDFSVDDKFFNATTINRNLKAIAGKLGYESMFPTKINSVVIYGLDKNRIHPVKFNDESVSIFKKDVLNVIKCISNNIFYHSSSSKCARCPYFTKCSL